MSLRDKLQAMKEQSAQKIPKEALEVMHRATRALAESDIVEGVIRAGQPLPAFALPDSQGQTVESSSLLDRGPLVATVYRGVW